MMRRPSRAALASVTLAGGLVAAGSWSWPVAAPHPIQRPFIAPATVYSAGHRGIDIAISDDRVLRAPADGVVSFAGTVADRPVLSLQHEGGVRSSYEPVQTDLRKGNVVRRGDPIGTVVAGHCAGTCVHVGVRINGDYVSPLLFLGGLPRAILWPASGAP